MTIPRTTDVLVVGAGPVGLSAAAGLRRLGVGCRVVERLPARLPYAKAVGIQPRTMELWDRMGLARTMAEAAAPMRGQLLYLNGAEQARIDLELPPEVPYRFCTLPQYETERLLEEYLAGLGTVVERGTELLSFTQDETGVTARLRTATGMDEEVRADYLIGCDGAHSTVRKHLGLRFEGDAFPEQYMLADVEADWDLPYGYAVRSTHYDADGIADDLLVCIPLPGGPGRYRMSMLVPPELAVPVAREPARTAASPSTSASTPTAASGYAPGPIPATDTDPREGERTGAGQSADPNAGPNAGPSLGDGIAHGLEGGPAPDLTHIQAVVDRLAPRPARVSRMRWSSVFRISHRIVDQYGEGRVFVAGDAAHVHPPTGAQGMNTGIQDACNLAWKLALVVRGAAAPGLLDTYDAERWPVGQEVVGRTVRNAAHGIQDDHEDPPTTMLREAQLLVGYRGGPLAAEPYGPGDAPQPGDRAPDCGGLTSAVTAYPVRLLDVLRGCAGHALVLYAKHAEDLNAAAGMRWTPDVPPGAHGSGGDGAYAAGRDAAAPADGAGTAASAASADGSRPAHPDGAHATPASGSGSSSGPRPGSGAVNGHRAGTGPGGAGAAAPGGTGGTGAGGTGGITGPRTVVVLAQDAAAQADRALRSGLPMAVYVDTGGEFERLYRPGGATGFVVRPDGHLGARFPLDDSAPAALTRYGTALSGPM